MALIDLTGHRIGKWTILGRFGDKSPVRWLCQCDCGTRKTVNSQMLRTGESRSCGCIKERHGDNHVPVRSIWYRRAAGIIKKCKLEGIPCGFSSNCDLASYLITIAPERCPVFGFVLTEKSRGSFAPHAASVDRIIPRLGYVRGNLQIISQKANTMKHDASQAELEAFAAWVMRRRLSVAA